MKTFITLALILSFAVTASADWTSYCYSHPSDGSRQCYCYHHSNACSGQNWQNERPDYDWHHDNDQRGWRDGDNNGRHDNGHDYDHHHDYDNDWHGGDHGHGPWNNGGH